MDKEDGYYSARKKNEAMPFRATWAQLEIIILSEGSQTKKDKYHTISHVESKTKTKKRRVHRYREYIGRG